MRSSSDQIQAAANHSRCFLLLFLGNAHIRGPPRPFHHRHNLLTKRSKKYRWLKPTSAAWAQHLFKMEQLGLENSDKVAELLGLLDLRSKQVLGVKFPPLSF